MDTKGKDVSIGVTIDKAARLCAVAKEIREKIDALGKAPVNELDVIRDYLGPINKREGMDIQVLSVVRSGVPHNEIIVKHGETYMSAMIRPDGGRKRRFKLSPPIKFAVVVMLVWILCVGAYIGTIMYSGQSFGDRCAELHPKGSFQWSECVKDLARGK